MKYFYRVAHVVAEVTKFKVPSQYKLFILKRISQFMVNKRLSTIRWATLYYLPK